jgi:hypothetical protein
VGTIDHVAEMVASAPLWRTRLILHTHNAMTARSSAMHTLLLHTVPLTRIDGTLMPKLLLICCSTGAVLH